MKQLRLMPGQDQRSIVADRRIRVPIRTSMTLRFLQQVAASFLAKLIERDTAQVVSGLPCNPPILLNQPPSRFPGRLDQRLAMLARGTDRFVG